MTGSFGRASLDVVDHLRKRTVAIELPSFLTTLNFTYRIAYGCTFVVADHCDERFARIGPPAIRT